MGRGAAAIAAAMAALCLATSPHAQPAEPAAAGYWRAAQKTAGLDDLVVGLHKGKDGAYHGLAVRGQAAWPVRNISLVQGRLSLVVPAIEATFTGAWDPTASQWRGTWTQGGKFTPLALGKGKAPRFQGGGDPYAKPQRLVVIPDGRWMNLYCQGKGSPTVILDSGLGAGMSAWAKVHKDLAKTTRICAYDRAGYGFSDPGPLPRESAAAAADLADLLKAASIRGPYVLVAHSAGSLNMRLFANWRFDEIAGMVLVDPSGDFQETRLEAAVPGNFARRVAPLRQRRIACLEVARRGLLAKNSSLFRSCGENDPGLLEAWLSEQGAMNTSSSAQNLVTQRKYGALPLIVLTRGNAAVAGLNDAENRAYFAVWTRMHEELAALSTRGQRRIAPGAGHNIQTDTPKAVVDAVNEVVAAARAGRKRP